MISTDNAAAAARLVGQAWRDGHRLQALPDALRPQTMSDGYAIQTLLPECVSEALVGWKIAATNPTGQAHIGVDAPIAGRLFKSRVCAGPARLEVKNNHMRVAEAEIAFTLKHDLPTRDARYVLDEVMNAVESVHPSLEIPDSRFESFDTAGAPQLAADNACAHWLVIGKPFPLASQSLDFARHPVHLTINGEVRVRGSGADVLGDPRIALTWLANNASLQGDYLRAGQVVTTGVCGSPVAIAPGDHIVADLGMLGSVEADMVA